jgi:hypothetical protein
MIRGFYSCICSEITKSDNLVAKALRIQAIFKKFAAC